MSKLDELIAQLCPDGVEYRELHEVSQITMGTSPNGNTISSDPQNGIEFHQGKSCFGNILLGYSNIFTTLPIKVAEAGSIVMSVRAPVGDTNITERKIAIGRGLCAIAGKSAIETKFIYYCLNAFVNEIKKKSTGSTFDAINTDDVRSIKIPIPPLPVQQEIVRMLDTFMELEAELEARKKQYEYYRDKLLTPVEHDGKWLLNGKETKWMMMGEIAEIGTGSSNTNEELEIGKYPFFVRSKEVRRKNSYEYDETAIITSGDGVGVGKIFHYIEGKYALHQRAYRIHIIKIGVLPKFCYYYMRNAFFSYIKRNAVNSSVTSIRRHMLENFQIPIPPLSEQERIVAILDRFDALCNDLTSGLPAEIEARRKQYEYYRDKLLTFREAKA